MSDLRPVTDAYDAMLKHLDELAAKHTAERALFAQVIREARKTHSLQAIADVLGVSRQRVDQISKEGNK